MNEGSWRPLSRLQSPFVPSLIFAIWSVIPLAAVLAGVDSLSRFFVVAIPAAILTVVLGLVLPMAPPTKAAASNWMIFAGAGIVLLCAASLVVALR